MKEVFKNFNFRGALNAEHYQVHGDLLNAISEELASSLNLSDLRDRYVSLYDEENSCFYLSRANEWTEKIQETHKLRLQQFSYVLKCIDSGLYTGEEAKGQAAQALLFPIKHYRPVKRMRLAAVSGTLRDFIERMREADCAPHIETLKLTAAIDQLERLNNAFITVYNTRSAQFLGRATSRSMKTVRPLVDKAFKELAGAINALYQANELTEKSAEKERQLGAIIDEMNAILYQLQLTLSRVKAGTKPNPGEESKPTTPPASETPTEPEPEPEPEPENPDVV